MAHLFCRRPAPQCSVDARVRAPPWCAPFPCTPGRTPRF